MEIVELVLKLELPTERARETLRTVANYIEPAATRWPVRRKGRHHQGPAWPQRHCRGFGVAGAVLALREEVKNSSVVPDVELRTPSGSS